MSDSVIGVSRIVSQVLAFKMAQWSRNCKASQAPSRLNRAVKPPLGRCVRSRIHSPEFAFQTLIVADLPLEPLDAVTTTEPSGLTAAFLTLNCGPVRRGLSGCSRSKIMALPPSGTATILPSRLAPAPNGELVT